MEENESKMNIRKNVLSLIQGVGRKKRQLLLIMSGGGGGKIRKAAVTTSAPVLDGCC